MRKLGRALVAAAKKAAPPGVGVDVTYDGGGVPHLRYAVSRRRQGKIQQVRFSLKKYGSSRALALAVQARRRLFADTTTASK
jgi:hypothetical protein